MVQNDSKSQVDHTGRESYVALGGQRALHAGSRRFRGEHDARQEKGALRSGQGHSHSSVSANIKIE